MRKIVFLVLLATTVISCQFTETMVLNEDGTGRMSVTMDLSEMMSFSGEYDSLVVKEDSIISFKQLLTEKKDSIAQLPLSEQEDLKSLEPFNLRMFTDSEAGEMFLSLFIDFESVKEANDIFNGLGKTTSMMPGVSDPKDDKKEEESSGDVLGVNYEYDKGVFKRDAFIKDLERHAQQMDSLDNVAAFMSNTKYKLKYTFPRKIKSSTVEDATYSLDGKTIELSRSLVDYFKDPDILDITIELEN